MSVSKSIDSLVGEYETLGFVFQNRFEGEYVLMMHPKSLALVRIYDNGQVWIRTNGEYRRVI